MLAAIFCGLGFQDKFAQIYGRDKQRIAKPVLPLARKNCRGYIHAMSQITFDTHEYIKTLEKGGISREQAEALANAQRQALSEMITLRDLATKKDRAELKTDLIKWLLGIFIAQTALVLSVLAYIIK